MCMCKHTANPPYCDGAHAQLEVEPVELPASSGPAVTDGMPSPHNTREEPTVELIHALATDGLAKTGHHGEMDSMGVPLPTLPVWDDIQILPAQLARKPLFDDDGVTDIFIDDQDTIYISELGFIWGGGDIVHLKLLNQPPPGHDPIARVTITNPDGEILGRIGGATEPILPGNFIAPHGIWADSRGDLYVGEVVSATGAAKKYAPLTPHALQKFERRG